MHDDLPLIARNLRRWRVARGLGQEALAALAGLSAGSGYISKIENGLTPLDKRSTIVRLANALGIDYTDLTGQPAVPDTPALHTAHTAVTQLRTAHIGLGHAEPGQLPPLSQLRQRVAAAADAWQACDFARCANGLADLLYQLHGHLRTVRAAGDRLTAERLYIEALDTAVWTVRVLGHFDLAYALSGRLHQAAQDSGDAQLIAYAAFTHSLTATALAAGDPHAQQAGHRYAVAAIDALRAPADKVSMQLLGMLHLAAAQTVTVTGGDSSPHVTEAHALARRTGEGTAFRLYFGPANVAAWEVHLAIERSDVGRIVALRDTVNPQVMPSAMRQAMFWRDTGVGLAQDPRRRREAVAALLCSEELAPGKLALDPLARELIGQLLHSARANAGGTELRRLARRAGVS